MREGLIAEVAAYCEVDVASTYRAWLVHEVFRGRLSRAEFEVSEDNLLGFLAERVGSKPHLQHLLMPAGAQQGTLSSEPQERTSFVKSDDQPLLGLQPIA